MLRTHTQWRAAIGGAAASKPAVVSAAGSAAGLWCTCACCSTQCSSTNMKATDERKSSITWSSRHPSSTSSSAACGARAARSRSAQWPLIIPGARSSSASATTDVRSAPAGRLLHDQPKAAEQRRRRGDEDRRVRRDVGGGGVGREGGGVGQGRGRRGGGGLGRHYLRRPRPERQLLSGTTFLLRLETENRFWFRSPACQRHSEAARATTRATTRADMQRRGEEAPRRRGAARGARGGGARGRGGGDPGGDRRHARGPAHFDRLLLGVRNPLPGERRVVRRERRGVVHARRQHAGRLHDRRRVSHRPRLRLPRHHGHPNTRPRAALARPARRARRRQRVARVGQGAEDPDRPVQSL